MFKINESPDEYVGLDLAMGSREPRKTAACQCCHVKRTLETGPVCHHPSATVRKKNILRLLGGGRLGVQAGKKDVKKE